MPSIWNTDSQMCDPLVAVSISSRPPPTLVMPAAVIPGVSATKPCGDRTAGIDSSSSVLSTASVDALRTSTAGASPGHRHRFLQIADLQLDVDGGREQRRQLDAVPDHRREARQRERDAVGARPQVVQQIRATPVRNGRADFLDQCRARRFNRDAWQHGSARVAHDAGNSALRAGNARHTHDHNESDEQPE